MKSKILKLLLLIPLHLNGYFENPTAPIDELRNYSGDFTDTDGDGMTDASEIIYGYDPSDFNSFPSFDTLFLPERNLQFTEYNDPQIPTLKIAVFEAELHFQFYMPSFDKSYDGFHCFFKENGESIVVHQEEFNEETLLVEYRISLSENNLTKDDTIKIIPFQLWTNDPGYHIGDVGVETILNLSEYDFNFLETTSSLGDDSNFLYFRFMGFNQEQEEKYKNFISLLIPIFYEVLGSPAEIFVCEFEMKDYSLNTWTTYNGGRLIVMDDNWNPRLFVHEMIHAWKGYYALVNSGENREYEEKFSGFEEVAEGVAFHILHKFVKSYPTHFISRETVTGGPWNNYIVYSPGYDFHKNKRFTGSGTFWPGDARTHVQRYSISGVLIQKILKQNPSFYRDFLKNYYNLINEDSDYMTTRGDIINMWSELCPTLDDIPLESYLNSLPVLNAEKLEDGFYSIMDIDYSANFRDVDIFSTFALGGLFWWQIYEDEINNFEIPLMYPISAWCSKSLNDTCMLSMNSEKLIASLQSSFKKVCILN